MFVTSFYVLSQRIYQGSLMSRLSKTGQCEKQNRNLGPKGSTGPFGSQDGEISNNKTEMELI